MVKVNPKLIISFGAGLLQGVGLGVGKEMYKMFQAADPFYETRLKISEQTNKKRFEHIMSQTDLKVDLA